MLLLLPLLLLGAAPPPARGDIVYEDGKIILSGDDANRVGSCRVNVYPWHKYSNGITHVFWLQTQAAVDKLGKQMNQECGRKCSGDTSTKAAQCASAADCPPGETCNGGRGWNITGGGLYIAQTADVVDLSPLRNLRYIDGKSSSHHSLFLADNARLASLAGLDGLRGALPGQVHVKDNPELVSLDALRNLTAVEGRGSGGFSLSIYDNAALESIEGLSGLRGRLPGAMHLKNNPSLRSLDGLEGLDGIASATTEGVALSVYDNAALRSLRGLRGFAGPLPGELYIGKCPLLTTLEGLEGIERVEGRGRDGFSVIIFDNANLTSVAALAGMRGTLTGELFVGKNPKLLSMSGLEGITAKYSRRATAEDKNFL